MKKRWAALLCAAALVFSLAACGGPVGSASHNEDSGSLRCGTPEVRTLPKSVEREVKLMRSVELWVK